MLQSTSSVFIVYRRKTLTGSLDPTHANGTNKPCKRFHSPRVADSIAIGGKYLLNLFYTSLRSNTKCQISQLCLITEKHEYVRIPGLFSLLSERNMASCDFCCLCFCICCHLFQCNPQSGDTEKLLRKCEQFGHIL